MKTRNQTRGLIVFVVLAALVTSAKGVSKGFRLETGKALSSALPRDFYLEGNAIPTEKLDSVLLRSPNGKRILAGLIDTSGYSSQVQEKYVGMLITETALSVCGTHVPVGSYGFGLIRPAPTSDADATFRLYNQAGSQVAQCQSKKDVQLERPRPLQVKLGGESARLYLGRYWIELRSGDSYH